MENSAFSCQKSYTYAQLRDNGVDTSLSIFDSFLQNFDKIGKWGKLDVSRTGDFVQVYQSDLQDVN